MLTLGEEIGWLHLRSRSVWLPTPGHTSVNLPAGLLYAGRFGLALAPARARLTP